MAVQTPVDYTEGIYFITFTCQDWLSLFEITNSYDTVYKWFDSLKSKGHFVKGYVIMPNHLHTLIDFAYSSKSVNKIVSNGKRFMAYEIVERLKDQNRSDILLQLSRRSASLIRARGKFTRYLSGHLIGRKLHHGISLTKSSLTYIITPAVAFGS